MQNPGNQTFKHIHHMQNPGNQWANIQKHTSHARPRKPKPKTTKGRSTSKILEVELEFVLVISRSLCLAMLCLVCAFLFVLLDSGHLIMHGLIREQQTHNWDYVKTYRYLCFSLHLCTFRQSICRPSSRSIHMYNRTSSSIFLFFQAGISQFPTTL